MVCGVCMCKMCLLILVVNFYVVFIVYVWVGDWCYVYGVFCVSGGVVGCVVEFDVVGGRYEKVCDGDFGL